MNVEAYLFFEGRTEEAIDYYKKTLGAELTTLIRYKESPDQTMCPQGPGAGEKVMHALFRIGDTKVMASDGMNSGAPSFKGFALTLNVTNEAEADRVFAALADGGQVQMPLSQTFFSKRFGMLADRFGVNWMIVLVP